MMGGMGIWKIGKSLGEEEVRNRNMRPFDLFYGGHGEEMVKIFRESENVMQNSPAFIAFKSMAIYFRILSSKKTKNWREEGGGRGIKFFEIN